MKPELLYLTYVTVFTALLWVPYVLDRIITGGLVDAVGYPSHPRPQSAWAVRLLKAHVNAVENLVVFATLVLVAVAMGVGGGAVVTACIVYFWARVVHALVYTLAIPWARTLAFVVGFGAQMTVAWQILGR